MKKYQTICFSFLFLFFVSTAIAQAKKDEKLPVHVPYIKEHDKALNKVVDDMDKENQPPAKPESTDKSKSKGEPGKTFDKPKPDKTKPDKPEKTPKPGKKG